MQKKFFREKMNKLFRFKLWFLCNNHMYFVEQIQRRIRLLGLNPNFCINPMCVISVLNPGKANTSNNAETKLAQDKSCCLLKFKLEFLWILVLNNRISNRRRSRRPKEIITTQVCAIMQRHYLPRTGRAVVALGTTILILTSVLSTEFVVSSTEFVFFSKEEKVDTLCKCKRTLQEHAKTKWFFDITRSIFFIFEDFFSSISNISSLSDTTCGLDAWRKGDGQKIVGFSLYEVKLISLMNKILQLLILQYFVILLSHNKLNNFLQSQQKTGLRGEKGRRRRTATLLRPPTMMWESHWDDVRQSPILNLLICYCFNNHYLYCSFY